VVADHLSHAPLVAALAAHVRELEADLERARHERDLAIVRALSAGATVREVGRWTGLAFGHVARAARATGYVAPRRGSPPRTLPPLKGWIAPPNPETEQ
jgi:hypothetical protein